MLILQHGRQVQVSQFILDLIYKPDQMLSKTGKKERKHSALIFQPMVLTKLGKSNRNIFFRLFQQIVLGCGYMYNS